jgi:hypothetical protein
MPRPSAPRAEKDITLVDIVAFDYIFPDLFLFNRVLKDVDLFDGTIFQGDIEPVKNGAVVGAGFVVDFFEVFGEDFADQFVDFFELGLSGVIHGFIH